MDGFELFACFCETMADSGYRLAEVRACDEVEIGEDISLAFAFITSQADYGFVVFEREGMRFEARFCFTADFQSCVSEFGGLDHSDDKDFRLCVNVFLDSAINPDWC